MFCFKFGGDKTKSSVEQAKKKKNYYAATFRTPFFLFHRQQQNAFSCWSHLSTNKQTLIELLVAPVDVTEENKKIVNGDQRRKRFNGLTVFSFSVPIVRTMISILNYNYRQRTITWTRTQNVWKRKYRLTNNNEVFFCLILLDKFMCCFGEWERKDKFHFFC